MMGSLVLVPGLPARAVVGCTWSLAFASLYVLVQPYTTAQLNGLSAAAVWLVVCVYAGGVMVVCRPCGYNDVALGMILLLFSLALISWALFLQFERIQRDGNIVAVLEGRSRGFALTHDGTSSQFQPEQAPGISSSTAVQRVSSITAAIRTSLKKLRQPRCAIAHEVHALFDPGAFQEMWQTSSFAHQKALVRLMMDWLERNLTLPVSHATWDSALFVLKLMPMNDAAFGDVTLGLALTLDGELQYARVRADGDGENCVLVQPDGIERMATLQAPTWDASPDARSRSRSSIGASQVPEWSLITVDREEIPLKASPWTALQYMIREKNCRLCARFHALRDELVENSEGGRAARDLESFGSIQQELPAPALDLVGCFPDDSASLVKLNLDKSVYPHIMLLNAEVSRACFLSLLETVCPRDDPRYKLQVGPIKKLERFVVKTAEYRAEAKGDSKWPFVSQVGDLLRATLICVDGDALYGAVQRIIAVFDLREGNGRLKNMLGIRERRRSRLKKKARRSAQECVEGVAGGAPCDFAARARCAARRFVK